MILSALTVDGARPDIPFAPEHTEYWGQADGSIKICAASLRGEVLINGGRQTEFLPSIGLNTYILTLPGAEEEFRLNIIRRLPADKAFAQPMRPGLHFTPELFSLNDPNGLIYDAYTGVYHLFFQCDYPYRGYKVQGDTKAWGHAVSRDLISWQELPVAIYPDENGVIWSGSGVVDRDNTSGLFDASTPPESRMVFLYTYFGGKNGLGNCSVGMAYSKDHCNTLIKYGPVIPNENNVYSEGFRDPKVIWYANPELENGGIWLLIACGDHAMLFSSPDLISWSYASAVLDADGKPLTSECPDLFPMEYDGKTVWVLFAAGAWYVLGGIELNSQGKPVFITKSEKIYPCNGVAELWPGSAETYGLFPENYASQTFYNTADGRRIQVSWVRDFYADPEKPWWNAISISTGLRLVETQKGPRIAFYAINEWKSLVKRQLFRADGSYTPDCGLCKLLGSIDDDPLLIKARLISRGSEEFGFTLMNGAVRISYNVRTGILTTDKSRAGGAAAFVYSGPVLWEEPVDMLIIQDKCAVDVYCNGVYHGGMAYGSGAIGFFTDGQTEGKIEVCNLRPPDRSH